MLILFISCESDSLNEDTQLSSSVLENQISENNFKTVNSPGGVSRVSIGISGHWHRGKKWSKRHNVAPCSQSFGLC